MNLRTLSLASLILITAAALPAAAQPSITWSTIDGGGGSTSGGTFSVRGTLGQPDATKSAALAGGAFSITGGFWPVAPCPADFNASGAVTVQDIFDFLAAWFAHSTSADFNGQNGVTVQDIFDFLAAWFSKC